METRTVGIEPTLTILETVVLPLNYIRLIKWGIRYPMQTNMLTGVW